MVVCQACGAQNISTSQYCDECGDALNKYQPPNVAEISGVSGEIRVSKGESREHPVFKSTNVTSVGGARQIVEAAEDGTSENGTGAESNQETPVQRGTAQAFLIVERGGMLGEKFAISSNESYIGRWDADNGVFPDIDLDSHDLESKVSRKHARIIFKEDEYYLEDLGSTNGTFVNRGRRLIPGNPMRLKEGDEIIVGKTFLRFETQD